MNTVKGGQTLRNKMIAKYGSYEAYLDYMHSLSSKGGKVSGIVKGFAVRPDLASKLGKIGGTISRRPKKVVK